MEFRSESLDFSQPLSGSGPRSASKTLVFPRTVKSAAAGITGYQAEYSGGNDHHVGRLEVRLDTSLTSNTVTVDGFLGVRDWSGNWDDQYDGNIDFVVVAELESATATPPRNDLIVTGMEVNQATQYFRSSRFLDPANVRPDNSIFLIARKTTGVRVFVDWDASAGLPTIAQLTGQLVISTGRTTVTLNPINPNGAITPRRDSNINPAVANHTLNFMIPAALSVGTITVTCEVFDQALPGSRSAAFTRTLVFTAVEPLSLFLVGVNTVTPAANAPTQTQISNALTTLVKTFPYGDILQTGFTVITLTPAIGGGTAPSSGCGTAWSNLLDQLKDLRGGSSDVYFGGLPAGIACGGAVLGCSPVGDHVAAAFIDVLPAVPHEVGHALGRRHAPCVGCSPPAQGTDSGFPQYNSFNSDSIGVFGFDPATNSVFNPSATLDFMSAFVSLTCAGAAVTGVSSRWISPYTHQGLLGSVVGGPSPGSLMNQNVEAVLLFLGLSITRERQVTRRFSFHYLAPPQGRSACTTDFSYEFLDEDRQVLDCGPLHCLCAEGSCDCWPKVIRDAIPKPVEARWFLVWEHDEKIYEEEIPDLPQVRLVSAKPQKDGVLVKWESLPARGLCYLLHWEDRQQGVYRGVAPRLEENSFLVPRTLFREDGELRLRIYATSGIATGLTEETIRLNDDGGSTVNITLSTDPPGQGPIPGEGVSRPLPWVPSAVATDVAGRQLPSDLITWYDHRGNQIASGRDIDLRTLAYGKHIIRAVVRSHGGQTQAKSWHIERTPAGCLLHATVCDPPPKRAPEEHQHPHPLPPPCED